MRRGILNECSFKLVRFSVEVIYSYYEDETSDIIYFNYSYVKQHRNIAFPTVLLFHTEVEKIDYEINSKHLPEVIKGTLDIKRKEKSKN